MYLEKILKLGVNRWHDNRTFILTFQEILRYYLKLIQVSFIYDIANVINEARWELSEEVFQI